MQAPSACPCRRGIPWQGVLVAVSLLIFWNPHPTAQLTIEPVPSNAAEGTDVLLLVHDVSKNAVGYTWYRGQITGRSHLIVSYSNITHSAIPGPAFSGRETIFPNGSLLFMNVTKEDTGFYTLRTTADNFDTEAATVEFRVHKERTPGLPVGAVAGIVTGVLVGVALVAALGCFLLHTRTGRASVQHGLRDHRTPASRPGQDPSESSTSLAPPPGHGAAVPIYQELLNPDLDIYCRADHKADISPVSLLTFWNPHPTAQLTIEPVPSDAAEGTDVLLLIHNASQNLIGYNWFKGKTADSSHEIISYLVSTQVSTPGPAFSGGEKIYSNGSLLIQNVTQNHTGFYTLQTVTANVIVELATGEFHVHGLVAQPSLRATNTEPHSVAMTCLSGDPGISITWIFNSQTLQLTDRMQLSPDHRTLSIDPVRQEDAGEYQCEASNPASSTRSDRYRLAVISEERTPGLPVGAVAGIVTGVLVGVSLVAALGCFLLHTRTGRASVQHGLRDHCTPASRPGQGPSDSSTSLAPPPGHGAAVPIYQELLNPDLDIYCRVDHKADVDS
ncbi:pregnancy-specific glycoprotein 22-like [Callospermophilus lateralis]|uniref:pregnancy-specific glycoprotein 22-like n=1 Tax=Callospermophilus lateralis TaxID=76772 RepID=UPI0040538980